MVTDANALKDAEINGQTLVFALYKRTLQPIGVPDGWSYVDGVFVNEEDTVSADALLTRIEMLDRGMEFSGDIGDLPCVLEEWELDKVFATRELAEQHVAYHAKKARTPFEEGHKIEPVPLCGGCTNDLGSVMTNLNEEFPGRGIIAVRLIEAYGWKFVLTCNATNYGFFVHDSDLLKGDGRTIPLFDAAKEQIERLIYFTETVRQEP